MRQFLRAEILKRVESYTKQLISTHQPTVIAITGSVGKTSTKLAIAHVLGGRYRVLVQEGNYNTEFGLPLSLFELDPPQKSTSILAWGKILWTMRRRVRGHYPYEIVILEMGADQPGDITRFMQYMQPDIGVVTAVAKVHMEAFNSLEDIIQEKWSLARGSQAVVYNHDDENLRQQAANMDNCVGYGLERTDVWSDLHEFMESRGWLGTLHLGNTGLETVFPVLGKQSVYGLTAAAAVGEKCDIPPRAIVERIAEWTQPKGRMRLLAGKNGSRVIDDSYNSNPYAAVAALDGLQRFSGRHIAIMGTMNELGDYEEAGHRLVGQHCGQLDVLVTIGEPANRHTAAAATEAGMDEDSIQTCKNPYQAGDYVASLLQEGDTILVKGSQNGVFAEESIKPLLSDETDEALLVRQNQTWLYKKRVQFR
jgi:UDP-N-acetylmuramyl pentapeptide synthase